MAITQAVLLCVGLCLLVKFGDAATPSITGSTSLTVNENLETIGTVTIGDTPTNFEIVSQTYDGQITIGQEPASGAATAAKFTLTAGMALDFEAGSTINVHFSVYNADGTATATLTITLNDIAEEFDNSFMYACLPNTECAAGDPLVTKAAKTSGVTATYSILEQTPNVGHLSMVSSTGEIKVATGKAIKAAAGSIYVAKIQLQSTVPSAQTSTAFLYLIFGCDLSSDAAIISGSLTLLLGLLLAFLQ